MSKKKGNPFAKIIAPQHVEDLVPELEALFRQPAEDRGPAERARYNQIYSVFCMALCRGYLKEIHQRILKERQ